MLNIAQVSFSSVVLVLAGYGLITDDFRYGAWMILFLGGVFLILGIKEMKREKYFMGAVQFAICLFAIYVFGSSWI